MQRREFLQSAAGWSAIPLLGRTNAKYSTALIGAGSQGGDVLRAAMRAGRTRVVALCDVDENHLASVAADVRTLSGDSPTRYKDFREMLLKEKPEICIVATPDHWHALTTIAAVQAGAHVWVETPLCHTIMEGRAMVKAAGDAGVVVQVGTPRHAPSGLRFLHSGRLGPINHVRVSTSGRVNASSGLPKANVPQGLDWEMWCGPAPLVPYRPSLQAGGFREHLEFANGPGGEVVGHFDEILEWSEEKWPAKVFSVGTRHATEDGSNAPDTQVSTFEFKTFTAVWEHRPNGAGSGVSYYGRKGTWHTPGPVTPSAESGWKGFLASIEGTKRIRCDIASAQQSTNMSLLATISMNLKRSVVWDGVKMEIVGDAAANALLARPYRHPWEYPKV